MLVSFGVSVGQCDVVCQFECFGYCTCMLWSWPGFCLAIFSSPRLGLWVQDFLCLNFFVLLLLLWWEMCCCRLLVRLPFSLLLILTADFYCHFGEFVKERRCCGGDFTLNYAIV